MRQPRYEAVGWLARITWFLPQEARAGATSTLPTKLSQPVSCDPAVAEFSEGRAPAVC